MMRVPFEERPRERLIAEGSEALSTAELLAVVLGSGTKGQSVLQLAGELLSHFGGLANLLDASVVELMKVKGIGKAKAVQIKALFALAKRSFRAKNAPDGQIKNSKDVFDALADLFHGEKKEKLVILLLDAKLCIIHREVVGIGTLTEVLVHPREVFLPAIRFQASSIIVAHNHPSGDPFPSDADLVMTRALKECGEIMSIKLWDHIIFGGGGVFSFKDRRLI